MQKFYKFLMLKKEDTVYNLNLVNEGDGHANQ
jgi:hypothetical protein